MLPLPWCSVPATTPPMLACITPDGSTTGKLWEGAGTTTVASLLDNASLPSRAGYIHHPTTVVCVWTVHSTKGKSW